MDKFNKFRETLSRYVRGNRCSFLLLFVASIMSYGVWEYFFRLAPPGEKMMHQAGLSDLGVSFVCAWTLILLTLAVFSHCNKWVSLETLNWVMLNYALPFLFIIVPLLITGLFPLKHQWLERSLFPSSGSLWVFEVLFFIIVQSEVASKLASLPPNHPEQALWSFSSRVSLFFIVIGVMCYMVVPIVDFYEVFHNNLEYKMKIGLGSFLAATSFPLFGILIVKQLHRPDSKPLLEKTYS